MSKFDSFLLVSMLDNFSFFTNGGAQLTILLVPGKTFHLNLIFVCYTEAYPSGKPIRCSPLV